MVFDVPEHERNSRILLPLFKKHGNQSGPNLIARASHVPTMLTVLIGILINNSRLSDLRADFTSRLGDVNSRIDDLRGHMDSRFDDMRATWHSELRRVEEVLDARLKHLEER